MALEIELKAHVRDSEALKAILSEKAELSFYFEKEDVYWAAEGHTSFSSFKLRMRKEKRRLQDSSEKTLCLVTHKTKMLRDCIEINEELEFEVNPPGDFEEILGKMGLKPVSAKQKKGWAFTAKGVKVELVHVEKLGWFVELELTADDVLKGCKREETFLDGKERLCDFLDSLGIEKNAIEERFYSELLSNTDKVVCHD